MSIKGILGVPMVVLSPGLLASLATIGPGLPMILFMMPNSRKTPKKVRVALSGFGARRLTIRKPVQLDAF